MPLVISVVIVTFFLDTQKPDLETNQREAKRQLGVLHQYETVIVDLARRWAV